MRGKEEKTEEKKLKEIPRKMNIGNARKSVSPRPAWRGDGAGRGELQVGSVTGQGRGRDEEGMGREGGSAWGNNKKRTKFLQEVNQKIYINKYNKIKRRKKVICFACISH